MKNMKIRQLSLIFLALLSLFVSSVSACTCSHHQEKVEVDVSSCHQHSPEAKAEQHHDTQSKKIQSIISETECCCIQPAPKVVAKSESLEIDNQILASGDENIKSSERVLERVRSI